MSALSRNFQDFFSSLRQKVPVIYPILLILLVPGTLVANTLWNLRQFDRDMHFVVRENSLQVHHTVRSLQQTLGVESTGFREALVRMQDEVPQLLSISIHTASGSAGLASVFETNEILSQDESVAFLGTLVMSQNRSFFVQQREPKLNQNVWVLVSPLELSPTERGYISTKMSAQRVETVISRTTRDALVILGISVVVIILLLLNHLKFFERSLLVQKLQEVDQMKDDFISVASHELKTPLVAIKGHLDLLEKKATTSGPEEIHRRVEVIRQSTKRLESLLEDILNVSRIEQDRLDFSVAPVEVTQMLAELVEQFRFVAQEKGLALQFSAARSPVYAQANADRVHEVFTNLLSNAIKYTQRGSVVVTVEQDEKQVRVVVKDTGIGIAPEDKEKLFRKFSRISTTQNQGVSGTGLGLWITKSLVERMQGSIFVDSIQSEGTAFTVMLPLSAPPVSVFPEG